MAFRVGQKVVCVSGGNNRGYRWLGTIEARRGGIYTIREIITDVLRPHLGVGLLLHEIRNPPGPCGNEPGFYSSRFRLIVERKTDISIFTDMLIPAQRKESV